MPINCDCFRIGYKSIKSCIVFRVVTWHYVSTKNKYVKANLACVQTSPISFVATKLICSGHFTDNIERKYFSSALKRRLYNKMIYSKGDNSFGAARAGWGAHFLYKRLMGMCDEVAFSRPD